MPPAFAAPLHRAARLRVRSRKPLRLAAQVRRQAHAPDGQEGPIQPASGIFGVPTGHPTNANAGTVPPDVNDAECVTVGGALVKIAHLSGSEMLQLVMAEVRRWRAARGAPGLFARCSVWRLGFGSACRQMLPLSHAADGTSCRTTRFWRGCCCGGGRERSWMQSCRQSAATFVHRSVQRACWQPHFLHVLCVLHHSVVQRMSQQRWHGCMRGPWGDQFNASGCTSSLQMMTERMKSILFLSAAVVHRSASSAAQLVVPPRRNHPHALQIPSRPICCAARACTCCATLHSAAVQKERVQWADTSTHTSA